MLRRAIRHNRDDSHRPRLEKRPRADASGAGPDAAKDEAKAEQKAGHSGRPRRSRSDLEQRSGATATLRAFRLQRWILIQCCI
ncbi:protein of unknown function [Paraburkholderia kururiensis]